MSDPLNLKGLLLAGGLSSRMGTPKHMLPFFNGKPIYVHLLTLLQQACPCADRLYISLRDPEQISPNQDRPDLPLVILLDTPENGQLNATPDIGPAAGLLAAYRADPTAHWLVLACDYPLMSVMDLIHLREVYQAPVTCYENTDRFCEPLVGIWSSEALEQLEKNVRFGITGPRHVVRSLKGKTVPAINEVALQNTNTMEEWHTAMELARSIGRQSLMND